MKVETDIVKAEKTSLKSEILSAYTVDITTYFITTHKVDEALSLYPWSKEPR